MAKFLILIFAVVTFVGAAWRAIEVINSDEEIARTENPRENTSNTNNGNGNDGYKGY